MTLAATPTIVRAHPDDAPAILALQRAAFEPEALACQTREIPPLQESVDGVREHIRSATVFKAVEGELLLGSVRGIVTGDTCLMQVPAAA